MLTLYQVEWCPSCHAVRQVLTELELTYVAVNVAVRKEDRGQVMAASGQAGVPVLQDGDRVLSDSTAIIDHLRAAYPAPADAGAHAAKGAWRISHAVSVSPHAAAGRLRELLIGRGFTIVFEKRGPEIAGDAPADYVLLGAILPESAAQALAHDARAPGALVLTLAIVPSAAGTATVEAADPVGLVWLYASAPLRQAQAVARARLVEVLAAL